MKLPRVCVHGATFWISRPSRLALSTRNQAPHYLIIYDCGGSIDTA
jgi:hypothetical protein